MDIPLITHPAYSFDFPLQHRFPMEKFALLHTYLKGAGLAQHSNTFRPGPAKRALLELAHSADYIERFIHGRLDRQELRRLGLPWSQDLVTRTLLAPAGTLLAAHYAMSYGVACHLAGGTHHAHHDFASGFCIFNDIAFTARVLLATGKLRHILIFDLDVHQGDGTARILANETRAVTCSMHCEKNFPVRKARSDIDIPLPVGMTDDDYLRLVEQTLADQLHTQRPDLLIYDAGVDVYQHDPLGLLQISLDGIARRDRKVMTMARDAGVPVVSVIGGGYDDDRAALARRHAICIEQAFAVFN